MGADVMRWQYCAQPPDRNLLFGFGPAHEIRRKLLTLWNSARFLVDYGNIAGFEPRYADLDAGPAALDEPLDRWLRRADAPARRRCHRPGTRAGSPSTSSAPSTSSSTISPTGTSAARGGASGTATRRRCGRSGSRSSPVLRVVAPVLPFLAEHLWQTLVGPLEGAPDSVFLAGWPDRARPRRGAPGRGRADPARRRARPPRPAGRGLKVRQPLARLVVEGAPLAEAHAVEIADELR